MVEIKNKEDLEAWLEDKPREVAVTIAARAALRVVPNLYFGIHFKGRRNKILGEAVVLPSLRALSTSWCVAYDPTLRIETSITAKAAFDACDILPDYSPEAANVAFAAGSAAVAAGIDYDNVVRAVVAVSAAAADVAAGDPFWRAILFDAAIFDSKYRDTHQGDQPAKLPSPTDIAVKLAKSQLWPELFPGTKLGDTWNSFCNRLERDGDHWRVWTDWYNSRLEGKVRHLEIELVRARLTNAEWDQEPEVVNRLIAEREAEVAARLERERGRSETGSGLKLPEQSHGIHIGLRDGVIVYADRRPISESENNLARLEKFHPLVLDAVRELIASLTPESVGGALKGANRPADPHEKIRRQAEQYLAEIDRDFRLVDYELLVGLGIMLVNRLDAEKDGPWDDLTDELHPLSDAQTLALQNFISQHGMMITGSKAATDLITETENYDLSNADRDEIRTAGIELTNAMKDRPDIVDPNTAETIGAAVENIGQGRAQERSTVFGIGTLRNTGIVLGAGGILAGIGAIAVNAPIALVGIMGALALVVTEVTKKSKAFGSVVSPLVRWVDSLSEKDKEKLESLSPDQMRKIASFTLEHEDKLRKIAGNRPEFRWLHQQLDWLKDNFDTDEDGGDNQ